MVSTLVYWFCSFPLPLAVEVDLPELVWRCVRLLHSFFRICKMTEFSTVGLLVSHILELYAGQALLLTDLNVWSLIIAIQVVSFLVSIVSMKEIYWKKWLTLSEKYLQV